MSNEIRTHHVYSDPSQELTIRVTDEPGSGGAHHRYEVSNFCLATNGSAHDTETAATQGLILFQNGPIPEKGRNGYTIEALLAICGHRLECFQAGDFPCAENAAALNLINQAMSILQTRTAKRILRGVEGREVQ